MKMLKEDFGFGLVWPPHRQRSSSKPSSHGLPASCSRGSSSALSGSSGGSSRLWRLLLSARRSLWGVGKLPLGLCSELTSSIKPFLHTRLLTRSLQSRLWEEGLSAHWSSFSYSHQSSHCLKSPLLFTPVMMTRDGNRLAFIRYF